MARALGSFERHLNPNRFANFAEFSKGVLRSNYCSFYEEFLADAGATLPTPWGKQDTSAAGTPTLDYTADLRNGIYRLAHDATSEAQNLTLYFADQLCIPAIRGWVFECQLAVDLAGATFSADQRIVIGMASARNATLDNIVSNAWFRIEGASLNILTESDDGTTDTDDQASGFAIVDNTQTRFLIDASVVGQIRYFVDVGGGEGWQACAVTHAATQWGINNRLQPYIEIQRDAGTELEVVNIDYVACAWAR